MDGGYRTEVGEVLFSLQVILAREQQRPEALSPAPALTGAAPRIREHAHWLPEFWRAERSPVIPFADNGRPRDGQAAGSSHPSVPRPSGQGRPPSDLGLIDPGTGAGSIRALRRDLSAELSLSSAGSDPPALVAVRVQPVAREGENGGPAQDDLMKAVVEAVPFIVRGRDRVYRTGPHEVALLMPTTTDEGAKSVLLRLVREVPKVLAERRLGQVRLVARRLATESLRDGADGSAAG